MKRYLSLFSSIRGHYVSESFSQNISQSIKGEDEISRDAALRGISGDGESKRELTMEEGGGRGTQRRERGDVLQQIL